MKRTNSSAPRRCGMGLPSRPSAIAMRLSMVFAGTAVLFSPIGHAGPTGGNVVAGQATISQPTAGQTQIRQSTQRAVIDWQSFGIGRGESVNFAQPSSSSATLNRVIGNDPSAILGSMRANGQVFLVNQNGVYVGPGAQIDVGGLVLSTANISNNNFMAGRLLFDQPGKPDAKVVNEGQITVGQGGLLAMVAPGVENSGVISARLGTVVLAGARTYSLDLYGDGLINLVIPPADLAQIMDATGKPLSHYVNQSGAITAQGGRVLLSAGAANSLVNSAVNVSGTIQASAPGTGNGGSVSLLAGKRLDVSGQVLATGAAGGGSIDASAENIAMGSSALLDASGGVHGGRIHVGGNFQGGSPVAGASTTASTLTVASGAQAKANASSSVGNGGTVVMWSDQDTRFSGTATAIAGAMGGDGGLIEVSGKDKLSFQGSANASAPAGRAGTLLLDPGTLTVADSGGGSFSANGTDSTVSAATVSATLRGGTSVSLVADDDVRINALIDARPFQGSTDGIAGAGLSLNAGRSIEVNQPIVLNGGAFSANAKSGSFSQAASAPIVSFAADGNTFSEAPFEITAGQNIAANYLATKGNVSLRSDKGSIGVGALIGGTDPASQIGNFSASAANGEVRLSGVGSRGTATVKASRVSGLGGIYAAGGIDIGATGGDELRLESLQTVNGPINVAAGGAIVLPTGESIRSAGANIALTSGSKVTADGVFAANDLNPPATDARRDVTINAAGDVKVGQIIASGKTAITSTQGGIELSESLGGPDKEQPRLGSLYLTAWGNIVTRGLNLAGTPTGAQESLVLEAGTRRDSSGIPTFNPAGGTILVADRIGVSEGDLRFGANDPQVLGEEFRTILQQGVYARQGDQNISFHTSIEVDGSRILTSWREVLGNQPTSSTEIASTQSDLIADMILIPRFFESSQSKEQNRDFLMTDDLNLTNASAANAVMKRNGGYLVIAENGKILTLCPNNGCGHDLERQYWMLPKIVISNQDNASFGPGPGGAYGSVTVKNVISPSSAALKIIVPASSTEAGRATAIRPGLSLWDGYRYIALKTRADLQACREVPCTYFSAGFDNLNAPIELLKSINVGVYSGSASSGYLYSNGFVDVPIDYLPDAPNAPLSVVFYPGPISSEYSHPSIDTITMFQAATDDFEFRSNSTPIGFSSTNPNTLTLQNQIIASLIPKAPTITVSGHDPKPAELPRHNPASAIDTAFAQDLDQKINIAQSESGCDSQTRTVVGRSSGDEADKGSTSALYGAPRPILRTRYSLGSVSASMADSADASSIGGASAGSGGSTSCM